jgi:hypothetical protein
MSSSHRLLILSSPQEGRKKGKEGRKDGWKHAWEERGCQSSIKYNQIV